MAFRGGGGGGGFGDASRVRRFVGLALRFVDPAPAVTRSSCAGVRAFSDGSYVPKRFRADEKVVLRALWADDCDLGLSSRDTSRVRRWCDSGLTCPKVLIGSSWHAWISCVDHPLHTT